MTKLQKEDLIAIKDKHNLVDMVGESVELSHVSQGDFLGRCPFHPERTKSFRVNKNRYHCFGCGAHGDVFSWLRKANGVSFAEAVRILGTPSGLTPLRGPNIPEWGRGPSLSEYDASKAYRASIVNKKLHACYKKCLAEHKDKEPWSYITSRLTPALIDMFGIGYAPLSVARPKGVKDDALVESGYYRRLDDGSLLPRLRDRIVIPLINQHGIVKGFSGRLVPKESNAHLPKYLHPPEGHGFSKKRFLFGLNHITPGDAIVVVEGEMDCMALYGSGWRSVVAASGCNLSKEQINLLENYTNRIVVMFDGDKAGLEGAVRLAKELFNNSSLKAKFLLLTDGADPDSLVRLGRTTPHAMNSRMVRLSAFYSQNLYVPAMTKPKYYRGKLDELIKPYVDSNIKEGLAHYNVVDYVIQAYPNFAQEIKDTLAKMLNDCDSIDGVLHPKDEHIKAFIRAWAKPSREVRKVHAKV